MIIFLSCLKFHLFVISLVDYFFPPLPQLVVIRFQIRTFQLNKMSLSSWLYERYMSSFPFYFSCVEWWGLSCLTYINWIVRSFTVRLYKSSWVMYLTFFGIWYISVSQVNVTCLKDLIDLSFTLIQCLVTFYFEWKVKLNM